VPGLDEPVIAAELPLDELLPRYAAVGRLARAISDDATICYLQDVRTDDEPAQRARYEALGYAEIRDFGPGTLRAFVRFD
jgi:hypothetical protein